MTQRGAVGPVPCRHAALLARAGLVALLAGNVHAAAPLVTDDSGVLAPGACEAAASVLRDHGSRGWQLQLGCGVGSLGQLALAHGRHSAHDAGEQWLSLSGKTSLRERTVDAGAGLALAWNFNVLRPGEQPFRRDLSQLGLLASGALGAGAWHLNLGWARSHRDHAHATTWGLAAEWPLLAGLDLSAETYGDDRTRPWQALGLRWAAGATWGLNAALAQQNATPRARSVTLGLVLGF